MKYKVSGAIAIPKASWGCAPALPNRMKLVFQESPTHEIDIFPVFSPIALTFLPNCDTI